MEGLPAGTYRLGFDANADDLAPEYFNNATTLATASNVLVSEGAWVQHVDVLLGPASHLTGHVSGGGLPLRFVEVDVYADGDGDGTWEWTGWDETDVAGAYDVGGLSAGSYRLQFYSYDDDWVSEWYDDAPSLDTADNVARAGGSDRRRHRRHPRGVKPHHRDRDRSWRDPAGRRGGCRLHLGGRGLELVRRRLHRRAGRLRRRRVGRGQLSRRVPRLSGQLRAGVLRRRRHACRPRTRSRWVPRRRRRGSTPHWRRQPS